MKKPPCGGYEGLGRPKLENPRPSIRGHVYLADESAWHIIAPCLRGVQPERFTAERPRGIKIFPNVFLSDRPGSKVAALR
jgi:hypothetical protein